MCQERADARYAAGAKRAALGRPQRRRPARRCGEGDDAQVLLLEVEKLPSEERQEQPADN
ncbi:MAG TPA: hypothetical protein VIL16_05285 [Trebonia sp.]